MKKILIIDNGSFDFRREIIKPFTSLPNEEYNVQIKKNIFESVDYNIFEYDYFIFSDCIQFDYDKTLEFLKNLEGLNKEKEIRIKSIYYVNRYWHVPVEHWKNKGNKVGEQIENIIRKSNYVISYSPEIIKEIKRINLNKNAVFFEHFCYDKNTVIECSNKPVVGIIPDNFFGVDNNISNISGIHKFIDKKNFWNTLQFALIGFNINETEIEINKETFEKTEIKKIPKNSIWVKYERIITDNYKICSPEYTEFLKKYLPNNKFEGNIENESYKRVWANEIEENKIYYNILLESLANDKYDKLKFSYEAERAKKTLTSYKNYIEVIRTNELPKTKKAIMRTIIKATQNYRQLYINYFEKEPFENYFVKNLNFM
jgi:hypothetical protein